MNWIKENKSNILITIISGIIFLVLGFLLAKEKIDLYYEINSIPVISQNYTKPLNNKLKIEYSGKNIKNLTITEVKFFNKGNKGIKGDEISSNVPISFKIDKKYKIMDYSIDTKRTSKESEFSLIPFGKNEILIRFKYMNPTNSLTFRVIHTGIMSSNFTFNGKGFGFNKIKNYNLEKYNENKLYSILMSIFSFIIAAIAIYLEIKLRKTSKKVEEAYLHKFVEAECNKQQIKNMKKIASDTLDKCKFNRTLRNGELG